MIRATLSILGIYNVRPDIFDKFHLPSGVDRDVLEPELLAEVAELESLYTDPDILKDLIGAWSSRRMYAWTKLLATTKFEYNPIWNKDGVVKETETRDLDTTGSTTSKADSTSDNTHSTYGYNSGSAQPADKDHGTSNATGSGTSKGSEDETITRTRVEQGNIGVTTTQAMIREERDIADFDIYNYIIGDFKYRFCIRVY